MENKKREGEGREGKEGKKGVSYVEIFIAFSIFLIGVSVVTYFFIPFFRPEYRNALIEIQKNFEENFMAQVDWYNVVVNETGCISITKLGGAKNIYLLNKSLDPINFSNGGNTIILSTNTKEFYLLNSSLDLGSSNVDCPTTKLAEVSYIKIYDEKILNMTAIDNAMSHNYENLRNTLLPGLNVDFNITFVDEGKSFGKPLPSINIFSREKVYKKIEDGNIELIKVRFYVWG